MSEASLIRDSAARIFADAVDKPLLDAAERGEFAAGAWDTLARNGFLDLGATAEVSDADLFAVIGLGGEHALPLPFAETVLAGRWLGGDGAALTSAGLVRDDTIVDVPWGRAAQRVIGVSERGNGVVVVDAPEVIEAAVSLAGEPRDTIALTGERAEVAAEPYLDLAASRTCLMAGALRRILALSLAYATEREQFGRPISKFQAVQHNLAVLAAEVAVAQRAADAAVDARGGDRYVFEVAAAKARVGEAVTTAAELAHQVHGAMGYTHEHTLHHFTRRAWAWRDDYGTEAEWQARLGAHLAQAGADALWPFVATRV